MFCLTDLATLLPTSLGLCNGKHHGSPASIRENFMARSLSSGAGECQPVFASKGRWRISATALFPFSPIPGRLPWTNSSSRCKHRALVLLKSGIFEIQKLIHFLCGFCFLVSPRCLFAGWQREGCCYLNSLWADHRSPRSDTSALRRLRGTFGHVSTVGQTPPLSGQSIDQGRRLPVECCPPRRISGTHEQPGFWESTLLNLNNSKKT